MGPVEDDRFLAYVDGAPFFYLGDTAWELFYRLNREEADAYLLGRAAKGFDVIHAVALADIDGIQMQDALRARRFSFTSSCGS